MDTKLSRASILIHSHPYNYQQWLTQWLFHDDIEIPLIFDIYNYDNATRVVTAEWAMHLEQENSEIKMTAQTIMGQTLSSERFNGLLATIDSYIASLPDEIKYKGIGFGFEFFITDEDRPKGWNHNLTNSPQEFAKLFGNQYEFFGSISWKHAEYEAYSTVELGEGNQNFVQRIISNYHRSIEFAGDIRAALLDFISVNENAYMVTKQLLEKTDG